jgi:hypothetical protein
MRARRDTTEYSVGTSLRQELTQWITRNIHIFQQNNK